MTTYRERRLARAEKLDEWAGKRAARADADYAAARKIGESIRAQAETAIYSDDADAIERLEEKLADMIAERERYKTENAAWRKANREAIKGMSAWERDNAQPHRSYKGTNLSGNISRTKARIEQLKREKVQGPRDRMITARRGGSCEDCGAVITPGDTIRYNRQQGARCATCPTESEQS